MRSASRRLTFIIGALAIFAGGAAGITVASAGGALPSTTATLPGGGSVTVGGGGATATLPGGGGVTVGGGGGTATLPGGGGATVGGGGATATLPDGGGGSVGGDGATITPTGTTTTPPPPSTGGGTGGSGGGTGSAGPGGRRGSGASGAGGTHGGRRGGGASQHGGPLPPPRLPNGVPTRTNSSFMRATVGPARIGAPSFIISQFQIPPFLLPIYQACGTQYGIPWQVLAGINKIETAFGTNMNISSAGAEGWMQFMPATWRTWGVDANGDGRRDPYNPVDAICAAARYLHASGGSENLRKAIFAYNHADWYVDEVLLYARQFGQMPQSLLTSLTGLNQGDRFPVLADSRYADDPYDRRAGKPGTPASPTRKGLDIFAPAGSKVIAVNDGTVSRTGKSRRLGNYVVLRDDYGNRFVYAQVGRLARALRPGAQQPLLPAHGHGSTKRQPAPKRLPLHPGVRVHAGTVIGRIAKTDALAPHLNFAIRPAGKGAPSIDPKPILDGWKLLEATAIYRARGKSPLTKTPGASNVVADLLMPTTSLARNVLADPRLSLPDCGRQSIRAGAIDRRVLATLEYLADNGFRLSVAGLRCDRATGDAKAAQRRTSPADSSTGQSFEVTKIDRMRIGGRHSSPTLPDSLAKTALRLQGLMAPQKIVSSRKLPGQVSFSRPGHPHDILISFAALRAMGYQDPFVNATQGRTDMGVDYVGSGPINAIGNARILQIGAPGWPNGGAGPAAQGVLYQLLDGPRSGQIVYVYEGLTPTVHAGQQVVAGQQIARFYPGSSIEIGFADAAGAPLSHWIYTEGMVTSWGRRMAAFLASIGAPGPALQQFSGALSPSEWKQVDRGLHKIQSPTVEPSAPDG